MRGLLKTQIIEKLRQDILQLQGFRRPTESDLQVPGLGKIDESFPNHIFPVGTVHEFVSATAGDAAATSGFIAGLLGTLMNRGVCLWVSCRQYIFPPALQSFGIAPEQVIFVKASNNKDVLWILSEGLKCEPLAAVVGEVANLTFTESRCLQLAVEKSRVTGFVHRINKNLSGNVACISRWHIKPLPSVVKDALPGVGFPSWEVELSRIKNGRPGKWQVQWINNAFHVMIPERMVNQVIKKAV